MTEKGKKSKFSLRKLIYNDKYLIIISIILAIVIWCATSMNLSPETTKTISVDLTPDFSESAASQLGIKCYGDKTINVDVTVTCKKYLAKDISADNINVYLQTNTVTSKGTYDVPIRVESADTSDFKITGYYPTVYRAYFDVEDEKVMNIDVDYGTEDFIEEGYVSGDVLLSESSVTIRGPKSYISQVDNVKSYVSFEEKLSKTQTIDLSVIPVDSDNSPVDYVSIISKNDNITLTIPVLKETRLDVTSSFTGKPSRLDISEFDVKYSVASVNAGVLEDAGINKANIGNIDFSQLTVGENKIVFLSDNMESFTILDDISDITATVTVPDTYSTASFYVDGSNVEISNIPDGYKAEVAALSSYSVTVVGKKDELASLTRSNVKLLIDVSSVKENYEGVSSFEITAKLDNSDTCWVYGDYTGAIRIYK